jgi:hypothetical protein
MGSQRAPRSVSVAEETVDYLKVIKETDSYLCEVRSKAEETVYDINITAVHGRLQICY